jgi:hypothetical protein
MDVNIDQARRDVQPIDIDDSLGLRFRDILRDARNAALAIATSVTLSIAFFGSMTCPPFKSRSK